MPRGSRYRLKSSLLRTVGLGLALAATGAQAQTPRLLQHLHEAWTVDDGLPVNSVTDLTQTADGYLWLTTFDGLVRFDGARFTVYNAATDPGLPSSRFAHLREAADGSLLLITEQRDLVRFAEGRFDVLAGEALGFIDPSPLAGRGPGPVLAVTGHAVVRYEAGGLVEVARFPPEAAPTHLGMLRYQDRDGALWLGGHAPGLVRIQGGRRTTFTTADGLSSDGVSRIAEVPGGGPWVGTSQGVDRFENGRFRPLLVGGRPWRGTVIRLHRLPSGALLIGDGTTKALYRWDDGAIERVFSGLQDMGLMGRRAQSGPWLALNRRLFRDGRLFAEFDASISMIRSDREGNLWVATQGQGLHRYRETLFTLYGMPEGLPEDNVYPIWEDAEGSVWIGTWGGGLHRIRDGRHTTFSLLDPPGAQDEFTNYISALAEDHTGALWVGGMTGSWLLRRAGGAFEPVYVGPTLGPVRAIYEDGRRRLWVGSDDPGLHRLENGRWRFLGPEAGFPYSGARVMAETPDGALWVGTNGHGVVRYRDGAFERHGRADGLPSDNVRALYPDPDDARTVWVGTEDRGLARVRVAPGAPLAGAEVRTLRASDGLYSDGIHQILEDDDGRLWMNSNQGIFWAEKRVLHAFADGEAGRVLTVAYTERDGLRSREGNGGVHSAGMRARDGRLWFPTQGGAVVVDPREVTVATPPVLVEAVLAGGRAYRADDGRVELAPDLRDVEVAFTAPTFSNPERVSFRYRLDGNDEAWRVDSRRSAVYTNLAPGTYTFRVAASADGRWTGDEATVEVVVPPHIYETGWFLALCGLLLVGLVGGGVRYRVRRSRAQEAELTALVRSRTRELREAKEDTERALAQLAAQTERLQELDAAKSRFYANVSHEFRTPLTLTLGPLEDLKAQLYGPLSDEAHEELDLAIRNARRLLRLINQLLDVSKLESGQMRLAAREADLGAFLRDVAEPFVAWAERKSIAFRLDLPDGPLPAWFDGEKLEEVVGNLLSNAFKFTPEGGAVRLGLIARDGRAEIAVEDTGPGIAPEDAALVFERFHRADEAGFRLQPGTGIGLSLVKELVALHGGEIGVESALGEGSTFTVALPLGRAHLRDEDLAPDGAPLALASGPALLDVLPGGDGAPADPAPDPDDDRTTVLVVEDNAEVRRFVARHLAGAYRVLEAADGAKGLALAREHLPDLVLSDVMMPELDGFGLCRAIKADPALAFIPVVLLTARATTEARVEGLEGGADDYLTKPFEAAELKARVRNLIVGRQRLKALVGDAPPALRPDPVTVDSADDAFLEQVREAALAHLSDEDFRVEQLAEAVGLSRSQLFRRLRDVLGESPSEVLAGLRLDRAAQLLDGGAGTVSEVAYGVGFKSVSHFSKRFRERFGTTPTAYQARTSDPA